MDKREIKRHTPSNNSQPAIMRRLWILSVGSIFALLLSGSVLAASWLQSSSVVQMGLSSGHTTQGKPKSLTREAPHSASSSTAIMPTIPIQLTIPAKPVPPPNSTDQRGSIKPNLVVTTTTLLPGVSIPASSGLATPNLSVTLYFPSGYAIPAGESLTFNDIISNAPDAAKTTGPITLSQTIPSGLSAIKAFGTGWTITSQPLQCPGTLKAVYTNTVAPGDSVPPLTIFGIIARNVNPVLHMSAQVGTNGDMSKVGEENTADVTVTPPL